MSQNLKNSYLACNLHLSNRIINSKRSKDMEKSINNLTPDDGVPTLDSVTPEMRSKLCESTTPEMHSFSVTPEQHQYMATQAQANNGSSSHERKPTIYSQLRNLK